MTVLPTQNVAPRRWAIAGAALVCLPVIAYAVVHLVGHGNPDPGGHILEALRSIKATVPSDATEVTYQDGEPHWDSCDGREGTFGWSPVDVIITFRSATRPDAVVTGADGRMAAAGWGAGSAMTSPIGPGRHWTRTLPDTITATGQLTPSTTDNGQTIIWQVSAYAAPRGPRANGC